MPHLDISLRLICHGKDRFLECSTKEQIGTHTGFPMSVTDSSVRSLLFLKAILPPTHKTSPGQLELWTDCGLSPSDARARNCRFDPMLYAWIPSECFTRSR